MEMWGEDVQTRLAFLSGMATRLTDYNKLTGKSITLTQYNWTKQKNYSQFKKYIEIISPVKYAAKTRKLPPTLLIHARGDNQVPYSNPVKLKTMLDGTSIPHKMITTYGSANDHLLGGIVFADNTPFIFKNQTWVNEAKAWMETYLR